MVSFVKWEKGGQVYDFSYIFDVKQLKMSKETSRIYYRLRKGKYRAIFYVENDDILVIALDKREDIYRKWQ
jgi:mRNA interferase RelE/StbE